MADRPAPSPKAIPSGPDRPLLLSHACALLLAFTPAIVPTFVLAEVPASHASHRIGAPGMLQPHTGSVLVDYYEAFLRNQDIESFRISVSARYNEGTLTRLLHSGNVQARRASILALGLFGGFGCNAAVAHALRDTDPTVRTLADNALWAIWFRADSPENNQALERIHALINRGQYAQAIEQSGLLIEKAPAFAEAYNQRAIARFFQGEFAESVADCRKVLEHNPYHVGALSGMGQSQIRMGQVGEAIQTFRRALGIQPYNEGLRSLIADLESGER
ncbi:tetratricopeptide repeat protein [Tundrisphaera lichenicola]|uniref:HEAT repeat domain-containing protein n=1 Tax=Tundrisphaera lichenicola TaxID=2029860 RepID=UPI003EBACC13